MNEYHVIAWALEELRGCTQHQEDMLWKTMKCFPFYHPTTHNHSKFPTISGHSIGGSLCETIHWVDTADSLPILDSLHFGCEWLSPMLLYLTDIQGLTPEQIKYVSQQSLSKWMRLDVCSLDWIFWEGQWTWTQGPLPRRWWNWGRSVGPCLSGVV